VATSGIFWLTYMLIAMTLLAKSVSVLISYL